MEQQQFKVTLSVGTKLLASVVLLILTAIVFLNFSAIWLLRDDKRAYVFDSQATESALVGREFVSTARHTLDSLRLALATVNPSSLGSASGGNANSSQVSGTLAPTPSSEVQATVPEHGAYNDSLKALLENQSEMVAISVGSLNLETGAYSIKAGASKDELSHTPGNLKANLSELSDKSFVIRNFTQAGQPPSIVVIFADLKAKVPNGDLPVAVGSVPLLEFSQHLRGSKVTVLNKKGDVLFDTDPTTSIAGSAIAADPLFSEASAGISANGAKEYETAGERVLGSYFKPGLDLVILTRVAWKQAMAATYTLTEKFILLGLMTVSAGIIFAILFAKTITAPLSRLYQATRQVAAGNFDVELKADGRDEIAALGQSFQVMSARIRDLIVESVRKAHLESELAIASTVQQNLMPPSDVRDGTVSIRSHYQPANECGGDWWGYFRVGNRVFFMVADATGHGLPSALITAAARSCFSVIHKLVQENPSLGDSPARMLSYANRAVHESGSGRIMMTFFLGALDLETRNFKFSNAGHNPPWLFNLDNGKFTLKSLMASGQRLGEVSEYADFEEKSATFSPGDILFLYTDGLMEGSNAEGEMYGKKRARKRVESLLAEGSASLIKGLTDEFLEFNGAKPLDDDVTLIAVALDP